VAGRPQTGNRGFGPGFLVVLVLLGFVVTAAVIQERLRERDLPQQADELARLVEARRSEVRDLVGEAAGLTASLERIQEAQIRESRRTGRLTARLHRLRVAAGLSEVRGPGILVELTDSPRAPRSVAEQTDLRIQDVDLHLVVNALWRAGAEAVAVNGQRVVSTTAIRRAGSQILVNLRPVGSPYRVAAIGNPEALRRGLGSSDLADRFAVWSEVYGLGFAVRTRPELLLSAPPGTAELGWARPAGGAAR
jgi:uncharacterized protein YlxW (UPF0749 family)